MSMDLLSFREISRATGIKREALTEAFRTGAIPRVYVNGKMRASLRDVRDLQRRGAK